MNPYESLLAPISAEHPCGPDISLEPAFLELDRLLQGKPETQFSEAVPPDWSKVHERSLQVLTLSKHLQPATYLVLAALRLRGLEGLADGASYLAELSETFWDTVYPLPDADDNNNPAERMNLLGAFNVPMGSFGDPFRFMESLLSCPVSDSPMLGKFSLADWEMAQRKESTKSAAKDAPPTGPDVAHIEAALRDTPKPWLQSQLKALQDSRTAFTRLAGFLAGLPENDCLVPDFTLPLQTLAEIEKMLAPYAATPAVPAPVETSGGDDWNELAPPAGPRRLDTVQSREQVVMLLDLICEFYARQEPSSPVPLLLQRAKELVNMDFLGVIENLAPDALKGLLELSGKKS